MKKLAIFLLSVSLLIPTGAHACWDEDWDDYEDTGSWDDDDWYDDYFYDDSFYDDFYDDLFGDDWIDDDDNNSGYDDDVYDGGWLDDVVVTPDNNDDEDYDWGLDEDWWRTKDSDDDDYSDNSDDVQGWGDDDDGSSDDTDKSPIIGAVGKEFKDYKIQEGDKVIIKDFADRIWKKQDGIKDCVLTAMEYASQILKDNNLNYRITFADDYSFFINSEKDVLKNGIYSDELEKLLNLEFNYEKITYIYEFDKALDVGCPILSVIDGNATDSFINYEPIEHMIVIIGETESSGMYICIDPSDGGYKTVSSFSLLGDSYKINYLKRY